MNKIFDKISLMIKKNGHVTWTLQKAIGPREVPKNENYTQAALLCTVPW